MVDMMHHVPVGIRKALFEAAIDRVAPGGVLIYKDMRRRPRWRAAMDQLHDLVLARQWINHCPSEIIVEWAMQAGLDGAAPQQLRQGLVRARTDHVQQMSLAPVSGWVWAIGSVAANVSASMFMKMSSRFSLPISSTCRICAARP